MQKKKIIEWLNLIEDSEIRAKAIENCTSKHPIKGSIQDAIAGAFFWDATPQGRRYWVDVYESDIKLINQLQ